jgi:general secretion pathway protein L
VSWLSAGKEECKSLAAWWMNEMREAFMDLEHRVVPGRPQQTTIVLSTASGTVTQRWRDGSTKSSEFQRTVTGDLPAERSECWPTPATDTTTVDVVLPPSAVLLRRIWLPAAAEKNLAPIAELQLERELPVPRDQIQVDWHIGARSHDGNRVEVMFAVAWRQEIERLVTALQRWNVRIASIAVDLGEGKRAFNFSPRFSRRSTGRLTRIDRLLLMSAMLLTFTYGLVVGAQWLHERVLVDKVLAGSREPAARVEHMLSTLATRRVPVDSLNRLIAAPSSGELIAELSASVPPDTWLQQLEIRAVDEQRWTIKIAAITPATPALLDHLAHSPRFANVELQSSNASEAAGRERAELSASWQKTALEAGKAAL